MGTRSITKFFDNDRCVLALYCQFDGYPEGVGQQIADFVTSKPMVNGIGGDSNVFNGVGCMAAQFLAHVKQKAGLWYCTSSNAEAQDYCYEVHGGLGDDLKPLPVRMVCDAGFDGRPEDFKAWAAMAAAGGTQ